MKKVAKRQPYSVPILMRALDILEFLRASDISLKPDEISNATGVSRTTTYRILHTFGLRGYVAQDAGGRFSFLSVPTKIDLSPQVERGSNSIDDQLVRNLGFK
jgi:hypothetical protein